MRLLHWIGDNTLVVSRGVIESHAVVDSTGTTLFGVTHRIVAEKIIVNGWVAMTGFDTRQARYTLNKIGRNLLNIFCKHEHLPGDHLEVIDNKLICPKCGCALRCKSKQPTPHPANRWHWRYGPICDECFVYLHSVT
jgi:hypothetical protein